MANILQSQDKNFEAIDDSHKETVPTVDTSPQFKTLEEDEDVLLKVRAKMYRFDKTGKEWRERGKGDLKVLKHKQTEKIRVLMRRDKTYKICANHYISPITKLQDAPWNDKTLIYTAMADFTDGEAKDEVLAVQFTTTQFKEQFRKTFEEAQQHMAAKFGQKEMPSPATEPKKEETKKPEEKTSDVSASPNVSSNATSTPSSVTSTSSATTAPSTTNMSSNSESSVAQPSSSVPATATSPATTESHQ
jgi:Ran-binding protein 1